MKFFLKSLIVYLFYNCQPIWAITCESVLFSGSNTQNRLFQSFGQINLRLHETHGDGFGEALSTLELAKEIKSRVQDKEVVLEIDSFEDYKRFEKLIEGFDITQSQNLIDGVLVMRADANLTGSLTHSDSTLQIIRLSSKSGTFKWGEKPFNLYLEEAGQPENIRFKNIPVELHNDQIFQDENGNLHLRIKARLGYLGRGIRLPTIQMDQLTLDKRVLLEASSLRVSPSVIEGMLLENSFWGVSYSHKQHGADQRETYFKAIHKRFKNLTQDQHIYIFDFTQNSTAFSDAHIATSNIAWLGLPTTSLTLTGMSPRFNHLYHDGSFHQGWSSFNKKSPITIVHMGKVENSVFQSFLAQSELPVHVTGQQSLLEAIALRKTFDYEVLTWKKELVFSMANHALMNFSKDEAQFIISYLTGDLTTIKTDQGYSAARVRAESGFTNEWVIDEDKKSAVFSQLLNSQEKIELIETFVSSLKQDDHFIDSIDQTALTLTGYQKE